MNRKKFVTRAGFFLLGWRQAGKALAETGKAAPALQLWRNATLLIRIGGYRFLVDPMLSPKGAMEPVKNAGNNIRIPMTDLPLNASQVQEVISKVDAILLTHTHRDHWDAVAIERIPKNKRIICPHFEAEKIRSQGFTCVETISDAKLPGLALFQTGGRHGSGAIGKQMGPVAGIVLQHGDKTVYIAGDTIWCPEVEEAIRRYRPEVIIANAGGARFLDGGPIIMEEKDVEQLLNHSGAATVVAVHMEAVNHCHTTRAFLRDYFRGRNEARRLRIPSDGEWIHF